MNLFSNCAPGIHDDKQQKCIDNMLDATERIVMEQVGRQNDIDVSSVMQKMYEKIQAHMKKVRLKLLFNNFIYWGI